MPSNVTKCGVEECVYNKNHECYADGIEVMSSGTMKVDHSENTMCETFIPKE